VTVGDVRQAMASGKLSVKPLDNAFPAAEPTGGTTPRGRGRHPTPAPTGQPDDHPPGIGTGAMSATLNKAMSVSR
jgi:hypothetical protein